MDDDAESLPVKKTSQLLSELDQLIDQSSVIRDIVNCCERLHRIERITGPCRHTTIMRQEIKAMESKLQSERQLAKINPGFE